MNADKLTDDYSKRVIVNGYNGFLTIVPTKAATPEQREALAFAHGYSVAAFLSDPQALREIEIRKFVLETLGYDPASLKPVSKQ